MDEKTNISETIDAASGRNPRMDNIAKRLLAHKEILAHILKGAVPEYKDCSIQEIIDCIEGEPQVGCVGVHPDTTNIHGLPNEDVTITEGKIVYDIRFTARVPNEEGHVSLIINVEAQNKSNPGYSLIKRGIYYCSRLISAQKETEFTHSEYDKIKKVYSIWICTKAPKEIEGSVSHIYLTGENSKNVVFAEKKEYDLLHLVMVYLSEDLGIKEDMIRLLNSLFSNEIGTETKKDILENDFSIKMTENLDKEVSEMCNISEGVYEKGIEKGETQGRQAEKISMIKNAKAEGMSVEIISRLVKLPVEEVEKLATA